MTVDEQPGLIAAVTSGIKTFTLTPYVFSSLETVRTIANVAEIKHLLRGRPQRRRLHCRH